jgi:hypothetical protein
MRTRTRQNNKKSKPKEKRPVAIHPGDILGEDYKKYQKLLKKARRASNLKLLEDHFSEGRSSTEVDMDRCNHRSDAEISGNDTSSNNQNQVDKSSNDSLSQHQSEDSTLGKKRCGLNFHDDEESKIVDKTSGSEKAANKKSKKLDAKEREQIKHGYDIFVKMVSELHSESFNQTAIESHKSRQQSDDAKITLNPLVTEEILQNSSDLRENSSHSMQQKSSGFTPNKF